VRLMNQAVLAHRGKDDLLDDATLLCLDWKGAASQ